MPQQNGTTVLGESAFFALTKTTPLSNIALWFPFPGVNALRYRKVGKLRLAETSNFTRLIIVDEWDVVYPGIWPVFNRSVPYQNLLALFECTRPGLPFSLYWL